MERSAEKKQWIRVVDSLVQHFGSRPSYNLQIHIKAYCATIFTSVHVTLQLFPHIYSPNSLL